MTALAVAVVAAYGAFLTYTALALGWTGLQPGPSRGPSRGRRRPQDLLVGVLGGPPSRQLVGSMAGLALAAAVASYALFGGLAPSALIAAFAAWSPVAGRRVHAAAVRTAAMAAWPRMLEELRILTAAAGRSIPQALFDVGRRAPTELQPAFEEAHREWLLTTDFERSLSVLKARLADPTADAACETLLVAHQIGGTDVDRRLEALIADRWEDAQGRKDARAKQSGARFARRFVLVVPLGMAAAGLSVGTGRAAYQTPLGQLLVVVAVACVLACWSWAGRIMRLPAEERVFGG
ncbi:MAG: type II secretion system F family protein [Acidimicrobiia bacterium]